MIDLNEKFEREYAQYCAEQDRNDLIEALETIQEAETEFVKSVNSIQKYQSLLEYPTAVGGAGPEGGSKDQGDVPGVHGRFGNAAAGANGGSGNGSNNGSSGQSNGRPDKPKDDKKDADLYGQVMGSVRDMFGMFRDMEADAQTRYSQSLSASKGPSADVVPAYAEVQRISEMKFPQNVLFFLQQLVKWIKNLVLMAIDKLTRGIRMLLGMPASKNDYLGKDDLKLNLTSVKTIEKIGTPMQSVKTDSNGSVAVPKLASLYYVPQDAFAKIGLSESVNLNEYGEDGEDDGSGVHYGSGSGDKPAVDTKPGKMVPILMVDTTKDLAELKEYTQHFFDLFDNAVGSNNEDLFQTGDLEIMMGIFKRMEGEIQSGNVPTYEINGQSVEGQAIDSEKMRDNLIRTKVNTDNLKRAFQQTEDQIQLLAKLISQKQLIAISDMGVQYKFLSAATNAQLEELIDVLGSRIEEADQYSKELDDERGKYYDLVAEIDKMRAAWGAVSNVQYASVYQKQINNLFDSSKYMTQVIALRLTTLTMYESALKDLQEICVNLNAVNTVHKMEPHRFMIGRFWDRSISAKKAFIKG
jgi:hypothetical protein